MVNGISKGTAVICGPLLSKLKYQRLILLQYSGDSGQSAFFRCVLGILLEILAFLI